MTNKLFVGNLAYRVSEEELGELFAQTGSVVSTHIAMDRVTGKQRGFGFVEMSTQAEAEAAIKEFNGHMLQGRPMSVSISQPKPRGSNRY